MKEDQLPFLLSDLATGAIEDDTEVKVHLCHTTERFPKAIRAFASSDCPQVLQLPSSEVVGSAYVHESRLDADGVYYLCHSWSRGIPGFREK